MDVIKVKGYMEMPPKDYYEFGVLVDDWQKNKRSKGEVHHFFKQFKWSQKKPTWITNKNPAPCIYWDGIAVLEEWQ